ncbi:MAG: HDOD domain-containing protein [Chloroflexota bacterium]|nr:HDOD domain-containing protein [Chloroflexota bacterium]
MRRLSSAGYRVRQLRWSLCAQLSEADRRWVEDVLMPGERPLFERMPVYDQTHSVLVAREVERMGGDNLLLRAALLHDCGKVLPPHRVPLLYRCAVVVLRAISPRLLSALARPWGVLWPVYLHVHHPELGAREIERAGSPHALAELVRAHQEPSADPALRSLQSADAKH